MYETYDISSAGSEMIVIVCRSVVLRPSNGAVLIGECSCGRLAERMIVRYSCIPVGVCFSTLPGGEWAGSESSSSCFDALPDFVRVSGEQTNGRVP